LAKKLNDLLSKSIIIDAITNEFASCSAVRNDTVGKNLIARAYSSGVITFVTWHGGDGAAAPDFCIRFHIIQHRLAEGGNWQPGLNIFLVQAWYKVVFESFH